MPKADVNACSKCGFPLDSSNGAPHDCQALAAEAYYLRRAQELIEAGRFRRVVGEDGEETWVPA